MSNYRWTRTSPTVFRMMLGVGDWRGLLTYRSRIWDLPVPDDDDNNRWECILRSCVSRLGGDRIRIVCVCVCTHAYACVCERAIGRIIIEWLWRRTRVDCYSPRRRRRRRRQTTTVRLLCSSRSFVFESRFIRLRITYEYKNTNTNANTYIPL